MNRRAFFKLVMAAAGVINWIKPKSSLAEVVRKKARELYPDYYRDLPTEATIGPPTEGIRNFVRDKLLKREPTNFAKPQIPDLMEMTEVIKHPDGDPKFTEEEIEKFYKEVMQPFVR